MNRQRILLFVLLLLTISASLVNSRLFVYQSLTGYFFFTILAVVFTGCAGTTFLLRNNPEKYSFSYPLLFWTLWSLFIVLHGLCIGWNTRYTYLIIGCLFYFSLVGTFKHHPEVSGWILRSISVASLIVAVICVAQGTGLMTSLNQYFTVTGIHGNPNVTAMFLAMSVSPVLALTVKEGKWKPYLPWIKFSVLAVMLIALVLLKCRTAYIGVVVSVLVLLNIRLNITRRLKEKRFRVITIAALLLLSGFIIPLASGLYHSKEASADGRTTVWKVTLQMIAEKPAFGYGYGMFERNYNLQQATYFEQGKGSTEETTNAAFVRMAYNEPLENAVEGGLIGMILFLGVIITLLVHGRRVLKPTSSHQSIGKISTRKHSGISTQNIGKTNMELAAVYGAIAAFAVMLLFNFTIQAVPVMCLFIVLAAMITAGYNQAETSTFDSLAKFKITNAGIRVTGALLVIIAIIIGTIQVKLMNNHLKLKQISDTISKDKINKAGTELESLQEHLDQSERYFRLYGEVCMMKKNYPKAIHQFKQATELTSDPDLYLDLGYCYQVAGQTKQAEQAYSRAMFMVPSKFRPRYMLMKLCLSEGDSVRALTMAHSIAEMKPKVPSKEVAFYKREAAKLIHQSEEHADTHAEHSHEEHF